MAVFLPCFCSLHLLEHMLLAIPGSKMKTGYQGFKKNLLFLFLSVQYSQMFLDLISGLVPKALTNFI